MGIAAPRSSAAHVWSAPVACLASAAALGGVAHPAAHRATRVLQVRAPRRPATLPTRRQAVTASQQGEPVIQSLQPLCYAKRLHPGGR